MTCNIFTGGGFDVAIGGSFTMAWVGIVILVFILFLIRKWIGEEMGVPFSILFASVGLGLGYFITITLTCSMKWAFIVGLVGMLIGGFLFGLFIGDGDGGFE